MAAKPRVDIVGAGNLASALSPALRQSGYIIGHILAPERRASLRRARSLARHVGTTAISTSRAEISADVVWFCVPDRQISKVARSLAGKRDWKGRVALHSSGAFTSDELSALRRRGASVASIHPLMTFVHGSRPSLAGVPFAIEGDAAAVRVARRIVTDLRGQPFSIKKRDKAAYHTWGTFTSPLLTALLAVTECVATTAGVTRNSAKQRALPIIAQTVANYAALGAAGAFSGPIIRGDTDTVRKHLHVLKRAPLAREVYLALAKAALEYLPVRQPARLKKMLASARLQRG